MTQVSWLPPAWVVRAMSGSATFSDDMADTTAARAMHTTAVIALWLGGAVGPLGVGPWSTTWSAHLVSPSLSGT